MKMLISILFFLSFSLFSQSILAQADWEIIGDNEALQSYKPYYLKVKSNGKFLKYEKRDDPGINLGWGKTDKPYFQFVKDGGGEIKNGDKIAIFVGDQTGPNRYLYYKIRKYGINLDWSKDPVYEWELRDLDNKTGNTIKTNTAIGIVNTIEKNGKGDFLIYCVRKLSRTVNLAWQLDCIDGGRYPGKLNHPGVRDVVDKAIEHRGTLHPLLAAVPLD